MSRDLYKSYPHGCCWNKKKKHVRCHCTSSRVHKEIGKAKIFIFPVVVVYGQQVIVLWHSLTIWISRTESGSGML